MMFVTSALSASHSVLMKPMAHLGNMGGRPLTSVMAFMNSLGSPTMKYRSTFFFVVLLNSRRFESMRKSPPAESNKTPYLSVKAYGAPAWPCSLAITWPPESRRRPASELARTW